MPISVGFSRTRLRKKTGTRHHSPIPALCHILPGFTSRVDHLILWPSSSNLPSPARVPCQRNPGDGHATPPSNPDCRRHEFESAQCSGNGWTLGRGGVNPSFITVAAVELKRPPRVVLDYRPNFRSTPYDPLEKYPSPESLLRIPRIPN